MAHTHSPYVEVPKTFGLWDLKMAVQTEIFVTRTILKQLGKFFFWISYYTLCEQINWYTQMKIFASGHNAGAHAANPVSDRVNIRINTC